ncbi:MAG: methylenetetrahydrofolate reductase, partial [Nanoarchaeota archaeon]
MSDKISSLKEKLEKDRFVITAELEPPKGTSIIKTIESLKFYKGIDGVNVTDNQRAIMRVSPIAISHILLEHEIEPICQFTCRDKNVLALQSDLLGASILGVKNVVIMGGDQPKYGDHPNAKGVFEITAVGLLEIVKKLNSGYDLAGNKLEGNTNIFIGAVANPGAVDMDIEISKFKAKVSAGA